MTVCVNVCVRVCERVCAYLVASACACTLPDLPADGQQLRRGGLVRPFEQRRPVHLVPRRHHPADLLIPGVRPCAYAFACARVRMRVRHTSPGSSWRTRAELRTPKCEQASRTRTYTAASAHTRARVHLQRLYKRFAGDLVQRDLVAHRLALQRSTTRCISCTTRCNSSATRCNVPAPRPRLQN